MAKNNKDTPVMITILGPTATGKTRLAALVADQLDGEVISADSRQVYKGMNIGTGKDYDDYLVNGKHVAYHLVDIAEPGYEYNVFEFQRDFHKAFDDIVARHKLPVLCGGTGLYLEAALSDKPLIEVPESKLLRVQLDLMSDQELNDLLQSLRKTHNTTDLTDRKRTIRAIEIAMYERDFPEFYLPFRKITHLIFGIHFERNIIRQRITERLKSRLDGGMADEVKTLLASGLKPDQLTFYGLEYRYLTEFVTGKISFDEMFQLLNTAIHQFAKRQMTWFRRMEKQGFEIHWIDGENSEEEKLAFIIEKANIKG